MLLQGQIAGFKILMGSFVFQFAMGAGMLASLMFRPIPAGSYPEPNTDELYGQNNSMYLMITHFLSCACLAFERANIIPVPWRDIPVTVVTWTYIVYLCFIGVNLRNMNHDLSFGAIFGSL